MKTLNSFFRLVPLILLLATGCSDSGLKLEGSVALDFGKGNAKPIANSPVVLLPNTPYTAQLEQKREGFKMGQAQITTLRSSLVEMLDSLKVAYVNSNYKDEALKTKYESVTDTLALLKKQSQTFKKEYITSVAKWIGTVAVSKTETTANGKFQFESLEPGKYILASVYGVSKQTGLLFKSIEIKNSAQAALSIKDRDAVFYIDENEEM